MTEGTTSTMDIDSLEYDPEVLARYVHYYKTGRDINSDPDPKNDDAATEPPKKKKKIKKKNIPPAVLETRRTIQLCCRDNDLPLALRTLHGAFRDLVRVEANTFYQLLNLCEGTFAERAGAVHVGTPRNVAGSDKGGGKKGSGGKGGEGKKGREENAAEDDKPTLAAAKDDKPTLAAVEDDKPASAVAEDDKPASAVAEDDKLASAVEEDNADPAAAVVEVSLKQRLRHARSIHSLLSSLNVPLIEQAYTALVRLSSRAGDLEGAERYLDGAEGTPQCKVRLRTYSCLIRAYCGELPEEKEDVGDVDSSMTQERLVKALKVWRRMYDNSGGMSTGHPNYADAKKEGGDTSKLFGEGISPKISLSEYEYAALMSCATKLHDAPVMERLFSDVADMVLVPGSCTADAMLEWFRSDAGKSDSGSATTALDHVALPPREDSPLAALANANGKGWNIYRRCTIDSATGDLTLGAPEREGDSDAADGGACYRLKPVELTDRAWNAMRDMNRSIVVEGQVEGHVSKFQGGGKGKKRGRGGNGNNANDGGRKQNNNGKSHWKANAWKDFEAWIGGHPPYHVVIDGANVGYYEQNFAGSPKHVDYEQIDWAIRHLLESDERHRVIMFLHERHFSRNLAPHWVVPIFRSWDGDASPYDRLSVYRTPAGMNDDWYWMHAALLNGGKEGKPSVLAITNDEMRDHHFQMLAQGSFLRWKERHQVHFDFGPYIKEQRRRNVLLKYPKSYSRRIQRVECDGDAERGEAIVIPLPRRGDEGRFADGVHVAEEGVPDEETYVVVQRAV